MTIEKNDQLANIHSRPYLQKGHISCAYATCSYFCMGQRNGFYDIKIPVWRITDGSGFQFGELQMAVVSKWQSNLQPPHLSKGDVACCE